MPPVSQEAGGILLGLVFRPVELGFTGEVIRSTPGVPPSPPSLPKIHGINGLVADAASY